MKHYLVTRINGRYGIESEREGHRYDNRKAYRTGNNRWLVVAKDRRDAGNILGKLVMGGKV